MNKKELAKAISIQTKLTLPKAEKLVDGFCSAVEKSLIRDEKIVYSNFGTFYKVHYPSKVIFHPKLGAAKKMIMLPTDAVKWMPADNLKNLVNSGLEVDTAVAHGARKTALEKLIGKLPRKSEIMSPLKDPEIVEFDYGPAGNEPMIEETIKGDEFEAVTPAGVESAEEDSNEETIPIKTAIKEKTPENKENSDQDVSIYEELMNDGSKYESTFKDAIRVHKKRGPSFLDRVFKRGKEDIDNTSQPKEIDSIDKPSGKISLAGAGIFDQNNTGLPENKIPKQEPEVEPATPQKSDAPSFDISKVIPKEEKNSEAMAQPNTDGFDPKNAKDISPYETISISPASKTNVSFVDLDKFTISKEILQLVPEKIARKYKLVPIEVNDNELVIAMTDPQDLEAIEIVKKIVQKNITAKLSSEEDISRILDQYSGFETELKDAIETVGEENKQIGGQNSKADSEIVEVVSDNAPAARIVASLLKRAIRDKASDIHIEPFEKEVEIRFRQDGILRKTTSLPKDVQSSIVSRIKILSNLKIDEQRLPQDGRFSINYENRKIDFRVSTLPVANGEKVVMRVLDKMTGILSVDQLGIRGQGLEILKKSMEKSHGMTLVTGPTGSGKTTTLYALIDSLFNEGVNICTLEDPIEYRMPGINQSQVNAEIDYTFASGLRSLVRQDPDIIMIGEIRDAETAEMGVHAALTGHIVLSTLHTNDSAGAAPRLIDMGVEPFLLTSSINVIIGQRLARKICEDCKEELSVPETELNQIKEEIDKIAKNNPEVKDKKLTFFHGKGCKSCNDSGYKGRIGLYEVLEISETVKEMILAKESAGKIQEKAVSEGMVTMLQDGILKALDGITTLEEVWRTTKE